MKNRERFTKTSREKRRRTFKKSDGVVFFPSVAIFLSISLYYVNVCVFGIFFLLFQILSLSLSLSLSLPLNINSSFENLVCGGDDV